MTVHLKQPPLLIVFSWCFPLSIWTKVSNWRSPSGWLILSTWPGWTGELLVPKQPREAYEVQNTTLIDMCGGRVYEPLNHILLPIGLLTPCFISLTFGQPKTALFWHLRKSPTWPKEPGSTASTNEPRSYSNALFRRRIVYKTVVQSPQHANHFQIYCFSCLHLYQEKNNETEELHRFIIYCGSINLFYLSCTVLSLAPCEIW